MSSQFFWPFAQNPANAIPQVVDYDIVIEEPYPGLIFDSTAVGGGYTELRLVNGCFWITTNALFNPNTLQWEQDTPCNPALPAYALEQCQSGALTRYIAQPTGAINTPVVWVPVLVDDGQGNLTIEPLAQTAEGQVAESVNPTWNAGVAASMVAREVNVTDTSSAPDSYLDQLSVDGQIEWQVRKDGLLTIGKVPGSSIVGGYIQAIEPGNPAIINVTTANNIATVSAAHGDYVDLTNAQTITGPKTIADAVMLFLSMTNGAAGGINASTVYGGVCLSYGARYTGSAFTWQAEATTAIILRIDPIDGFTLYYNAGLVVGNTYAPSEVFNVNTAGQITTTSPIEPSVLASEFEGTNGVTVSYDAGTNKVDVSGAGLVESVVNTDGTLEISESNQVVTINSAAVPVSGAGTFKTAQIPIPAGGSISITLPGTSATTYGVLVQGIVSNTAGQFFGASFSLTAGTVSSPISNNAGNSTNTVLGGFVVFYACEAQGGQTLTFELSGSTSGTGGTINVPVIIQAIAS